MPFRVHCKKYVLQHVLPLCSFPPLIQAPPSVMCQPSWDAACGIPLAAVSKHAAGPAVAGAPPQGAWEPHRAAEVFEVSTSAITCTAAKPPCHFLCCLWATSHAAPTHSALRYHPCTERVFVQSHYRCEASRGSLHKVLAPSAA